MKALKQLLEGLKEPPEEGPIEPELKHTRKEQDRKIREEQDLRAGAVLEATVHAGSGASCPQDGDLVYVHYSVAAPEEGEADPPLIYSTRSDEGGSGHPLVFKIGKGWRPPRAWELALLGMTEGERKVLVVKALYGYSHPSCKMSPPPGVPGNKTLRFDMELVAIYPGSEVYTSGEDENIFKRVLKESEHWENPRAPTEVTFTCEARCPAYNGQQIPGYCYYSSPAASPLQLQLGQGQLPQGVELALTQMSKGEKAVYVLPADLMRLAATPESQAAAAAAANGCGVESREQGLGVSGSGSSSSGGMVLPPPPKNAQQVELVVELQDLVQVRDMTGDGQVTKRRLREGQGEFPIDCPLHDTTVTLHYRVRQLGSTGPWVYDSRKGATAGKGGAGSSSGSPTAAAAAAGSGDGGKAAASNGSSKKTTGQTAAAAAGVGGGGEGGEWAEGWGGREGAVVADTGCGELPEGLELCMKLMVPREVARCVVQPNYAYKGGAGVAAPAGIDADQAVEFEVELVSFLKEGYWQNLEWEERWGLAERIKAKGNELYQQQKFGFAVDRYTHLLRMLESTRDYETEEQVARCDGLKEALLANLAAACLAQGEAAKAIDWCDKALEMNPDNAKVIFRKGKALSVKGDYEEADEQLAAAGKLDPAIERDVAAARASNKQQQRQAAEKQKREFRNFFGK